MVSYNEYALKIIKDCENMLMYHQIEFKPRSITYSISKQKECFVIDHCCGGWFTAEVDFNTLKKCILNPDEFINLEWV
jgi:hypothetical protein